MKGLEIARAYFEQYGLPMLREQFPGLLPLIAAGLTGSGSECFGFDDEISRDHDFEPGFCLFLPDEEIGAPDGVLTLRQWLAVPEYALSEAVNGEVFHDGPGTVTRIRERLARYPEDIRRKKLAGQLLLMAQSGQYNYGRCLRHGETGAAQLAACSPTTNGASGPCGRCRKWRCWRS